MAADGDAAESRGIDDARVVELFRQGYLAWIEAHLVSLGSLNRLVGRLDKQSTVSQDGPSAAGAEEASPTKH